MEKQAWLGLVFLLLAGCAQQVSCTVPFVSFGDDCFSVELAESLEQKTQGLMFRESMPLNHGMLFIFDDMVSRTFWMKNTLIPLDMLFLDGNMVVVEVKHDIQPCRADPCPLYRSIDAQYVLELNAGVANSNGIVVGSRMSLSE